MGNTWKGISDKQLVDSELALLKRGGLDTSIVKINDVVLDDVASIDERNKFASQNFIHTIEINKSS